VRKLRRIALIAFAIVIAFGAIFLIGVNLYVQSQETQAKIQQELRQRLGTPLEIRRMSVTPWGGLELSGIAIAQRSAVSSSHFLEARTFRLRVRFLPLFSRRLVIKEVSLVNPNVVWPQDAEGKWRLPGLLGVPPGVSTSQAANIPESRPERKPTKSMASPSMAVTPTELPSLPGETVAKLPRQPRKLSEALAPEVQRVKIKGGNFSFLDRTGGMLASFTGVDFRTSVRSALALRGNAKVAKISLRDRFFLEQLQSPLSYEPNVLELSKISARAGSGEINGRFAMQPEAEDSPFTTSVTFRNVQADQIVTDAGGPKGMVQGKLEGSFKASGKTADPDALMGKGEIFLHDGRVQQYSLLVLLGQILQIEELRELHLEQAQAKYHVTPGLITIDELILRSPNIRLSASGTVTFNGELKLDSQLAINEKIHGQLFRAIRQNFQPISEPGYFALDFQVGGSIDRPGTNLMDKLVGRDLKDLGDVINSLLGGRKRERPKKKKKRTEAVTPAATPPAVAPEVAPPPPTATPASSP
jgi:type II secretion system protein N